jgi:hypothetical protein
VTSQHTAPLDLEFTGVSSQSRVLTATPSTATLAPGTSVTVDLSGELEEDWPQGTGDVILLRVEVDNGAYTDLLGASFIDTSDTASASDWWILD